MAIMRPTESIPKREIGGKHLAIGKPLIEIKNGGRKLEAEEPKQRHMQHVVALPRKKRK